MFLESPGKALANTLRELFADVAPTYERVNHILTLGFDILWRRAAAREAVRAGGGPWLDLCSGTGDMARELRRRAGRDPAIIALDFCAPMLGRAVDRAAGTVDFDFVLADVKALPFADSSFDLATISFATRNINLSREVLESTFREIRRILRPAGRFVNLETSQPSSRLLRSVFRFYIRTFVRPIGRWISGSNPGYAYLSSTIPRFYPAEELAAILRAAGFSSVSCRRLFFGVAAVHVAGK